MILLNKLEYTDIILFQIIGMRELAPTTTQSTMSVVGDVGDLPWLASWIPNCQHRIHLWKMFFRKPGRNTLHSDKGVNSIRLAQVGT